MWLLLVFLCSSLNVLLLFPPLLCQTQAKNADVSVFFVPAFSIPIFTSNIATQVFSSDEMMGWNEKRKAVKGNSPIHMRTRSNTFSFCLHTTYYTIRLLYLFSLNLSPLPLFTFICLGAGPCAPNATETSQNNSKRLETRF